MIKRIEDIESQLHLASVKIIGVAAAEDQDIMDLVFRLWKKQIAKFVLVGDKEEILRIAKANHVPEEAYEVVDCRNHAKAAATVVKMVKTGRCHLIMKGKLHTSVFLKAVLDKENGLVKDRLLSQITVYNRMEGEGLQLMTDCAMAVEPTLEEKKSILENAVELMNRLGYKTPKVAVISAVEVVNPKMKDTIDAAVLSKMCDRGQIKNCVVDGPLALDNAVSAEAAAHKEIGGPVAGKADILLFPNLQVGNSVFKSLIFFAGLKTAAVVMGGIAPIVMTSRTDTVENKLYSVMFAIYLAS